MVDCHSLLPEDPGIAAYKLQLCSHPEVHHRLGEEIYV
jgi:hypothetical protein